VSLKRDVPKVNATKAAVNRGGEIRGRNWGLLGGGGPGEIEAVTLGGGNRKKKGFWGGAKNGVTKARVVLGQEIKWERGPVRGKEGPKGPPGGIKDRKKEARPVWRKNMYTDKKIGGRLEKQNKDLVGAGGIANAKEKARGVTGWRGGGVNRKYRRWSR